MNNQPVFKRRWHQLWSPLRMSPETIRRNYAQWLSAYAEPHRCYHTIGNHIIPRLDEALAAHEWGHITLERPDLFTIAWLTHDIVCWPGASDNEARSVAVTRTMTDDTTLPTLDKEQVSHLILPATLHVEGWVPPTNDAKVISDSDLVSLGPDWGTFIKTSEMVWDEYRRVGVRDVDAIPGRIKMLKSFLRREPLFFTQHYRNRFEAQAKANLARIIPMLQDQLNVLQQ